MSQPTTAGSPCRSEHRTVAKRAAMIERSVEPGAGGLAGGLAPRGRVLAGRGVARAAAVALCAGAAWLGGCRGERSDAAPRQFFPDMDDQPRWNPQGRSNFFEDGRTMRTPVEGTIAYARSTLDPAGAGNADWAERFRLERDELLRDDDNVHYGGQRDENGAIIAFVESIPVPVTMAMLERGRERFNIYCAVCHGYTGDGKGMVGQQWAYDLPTFYDPKYTTPEADSVLWRDGYLFQVARHGVIDVAGVQKMPGYAHALSTHDTWAVVAYIRALQRSHEGRIQDVPIGPRQRLEQSRPAVMGTSDGGVSTAGLPAESGAATGGGL